MAKRLVIHDPACRELVLRRAKNIARGHNSVEVWTANGVHVATATPDGHIDATWAGSRYVSIVPTTETEPKSRDGGDSVLNRKILSPPR